MSDEDALNVRGAVLCQTGAIQECCTDAVITQMFPAALLPTPETAVSVCPL
jgi:hypothetical protein